MLQSFLKFQQKQLANKTFASFCAQNHHKYDKKKPKMLFGGFKTKSKQFPERKLKDDRDFTQDAEGEITNTSNAQVGDLKVKGFKFGQQPMQSQKNMQFSSGDLKPHPKVQGQFLKFLNQQEKKDKQDVETTKEQKAQEIKEIQQKIDNFLEMPSTAETHQILMDLFALQKDYDKVIKLYEECVQNKWQLNENTYNVVFRSKIETGFAEAKDFLNTILLDKNRLSLIYRTNFNAYIEQILKQNLPKVQIAEELGEFLEIILKEDISVLIDMDLFASYILDLESHQDNSLIYITEVFLNYFNYVLKQSTGNSAQQQQILNSQSTTLKLNATQESGNDILEKGSQEYFFLNLDYLFSLINNYKYPNQKLTSQQTDLCLYFLETCYWANCSISYESICKWLYTYFNEGQEGLELIIKVANMANALDKKIGQEQSNSSQKGKKQNPQQQGQLLPDQDQMSFNQVFNKYVEKYYQKTGQYPFSSQILENQFKKELVAQNFFYLYSIQIFSNLASKFNNQKLVYLLYHNYEKVRSETVYEDLINVILQSNLSDNNYRNTLSKIQSEARNQNVTINNKFRQISEIKSQILENFIEEANTLFYENFIKKHQNAHYKLKIKYFLMNIMKQQDLSVEYNISQSFINRYVNQIPNKVIQQLVENDLTINNMVKILLNHTEQSSDQQNMHALRKEAELNEQFQYVKRQVCAGNLSKDDIPRLKKIEDQLHNNEIYILENYDQLEKQYQQKTQLKKYMDDYYLLEQTYEYSLANTPPSGQKQLTSKYQKDSEELRILVNKLLDRDEAQSIEEEYKEYRNKRSTKQLGRLLSLLRDEDRKSYRMKVMDHATLKDAVLIHNQVYKESDINVFINENQNNIKLVNDFCSWGIKVKQPIAVYLTEYYYRTISQQIPNYLGKQINEFFMELIFTSDKTLISRKDFALKLVPRVERSKIYDLSQDFSHIPIEEFQAHEIENYIKNHPEDKYKAQYLYYKHLSVNRYYKYGVPEQIIIII
ncbi:hypothetical protein PPERSA_03765 [Pseudocohnilembus persalinus]|uniref:Uncharacterized protein n=1 Tax=Pseudocohnilembus persalinus TaxID=266149 RepID=A0A0V0QBI3_PSEPJ|nr:hypothetical protein PPERSA_03765 [Pseudocohnilembus persalinus]|eukprot:KRW99590.1 hypothetical protein PPERSA_03765 [Pseudocohnilembus persalinus]